MGQFYPNLGLEVGFQGLGPHLSVQGSSGL